MLYQNGPRFCYGATPKVKSPSTMDPNRKDGPDPRVNQLIRRFEMPIKRQTVDTCITANLAKTEGKEKEKERTK